MDNILKQQQYHAKEMVVQTNYFMSISTIIQFLYGWCESQRSASTILPCKIESIQKFFYTFPLLSNIYICTFQRCSSQCSHVKHFINLRLELTHGLIGDIIHARQSMNAHEYAFWSVSTQERGCLDWTRDHALSSNHRPLTATPIVNNLTLATPLNAVLIYKRVESSSYIMVTDSESPTFVRDWLMPKVRRYYTKSLRKNEKRRQFYMLC